MSLLTLSTLLYSLLYSTLVNSLLLIITNQSDIFDLTCFVRGVFFSSGDIRCAWLRTGERYVCAICDGIFRIRVIGTVLYYQSKWIPTSERRCTCIHCTFCTFLLLLLLLLLLYYNWIGDTRLDCTGLDWILISLLRYLQDS